jgi:hypothetical protein
MAKKKGLATPVTMKNVALQFFGNPENKDSATVFKNRIAHYWAAMTFLQLFIVSGPLDAAKLLDYSPWLAFSLLGAATEPALAAWLGANRQDPAYFPHVARPTVSADAPRKKDFNAILTQSTTLPPAPSSSSASATVVEEIMEVDTVLSLHPPRILPLAAGSVDTPNAHALVVLLLRNQGIDQAEFRKLHGAKLYDMTRACTQNDLVNLGSAYLGWFFQQDDGNFSKRELPVFFWFYVFQLMAACFCDPLGGPPMSEYFIGPFVAHQPIVTHQ